MVDSKRVRRQRRGGPVISPVLRPKLWAALLGMVASAAMATPAWADPTPDKVPSTGARPPVAGLRLPGSVPGLPGSTPGLPGVPPGVPGAPGTLPVGADPGAGPLIAQINQADALVAQLGDSLLRLKAERGEAQAQLTIATTTLRQAQDALAQAQEKARSAAADAVKAAAAVPPGEFGASLRDLTALQQITRGDKADGATTAVAGEVARATAAANIAQQAYDAAQQRVTDKGAEYVRVEADLHRQEAALLKLRTDNAALLLDLERRRDAAEQQLGGSYVANQNVSGLAADPKAMVAVRYALAQLGDPYLWAAEGPDRFDCSGLVLASYRAAGYRGLPRVSRDQYYATRSRTVSPNALLPGDLLFFASGSSWTSIHHVAMYIGNGKMVEAPRTGDVVKISVVRWSSLYAATRVIGAVPGPATAPVPTVPKPGQTSTPKPSGTPKPTGTPKPSGTPKPTGTPSTSPTPPTRPTSRPPVPRPDPTTSSPTPEPSETPSSDGTSTEPTGSASTAAPSTTAAEGSSASAS